MCVAETRGTKAIQRLAPPGKDSPPPLGGQDGGLDDAAWNSEQLIVSRVSALMFCSSTMLISSYKSKVVRFLFFLLNYLPFLLILKLERVRFNVLGQR